MNRASEKKVRKRGAAIVFCLFCLSSQPGAAAPPLLSTLPVSSLCGRAWGYLGSPVTLCPRFDAELPLGRLIPFIREIIYLSLYYIYLGASRLLLVFVALFLDWQVASHGKIPYPIGVMQQLVANWVECIARLSSVNPSVAVLSSVCLHLTGSKSVFVCLIVRSSVGVLCLFTNAKMSACVHVWMWYTKQMKWEAVSGPCLHACPSLHWFPQRHGRQSVWTIKVCLDNTCRAGALKKHVFGIIGSGLIKCQKST